MSNPILTNTSQTYMRSNIQLTLSEITDILENPTSSNMLIRSDVVTACNESETEATVNLYLTRSSTTYAIAKDVVIPGLSTMVLLDKDYPIHLKEGDKLQVSGTNGINVICSYTIISDTGITLPSRPVINVVPSYLVGSTFTDLNTTLQAPLPTGAAVGDWTLLSVYSDGGLTVNDTRKIGTVDGTLVVLVEDNFGSSTYAGQYLYWYQLTATDISQGYINGMDNGYGYLSIMGISLFKGDYDSSSAVFEGSDSTNGTTINIPYVSKGSSNITYVMTAFLDDDLTSVQTYPASYTDNRAVNTCGVAGSGGTLGFATTTTQPASGETLVFNSSDFLVSGLVTVTSGN